MPYGLTTLNKPKSREVPTNDGIITQNICMGWFELKENFREVEILRIFNNQYLVVTFLLGRGIAHNLSG